MRKVATALAIVASLLASAQEAGARPAGRRATKLRVYVVSEGDSCWSIAARFFGKGERYDIIHRYNRLGPLPHLLRPGQKLLLPAAAGGPDARVSWLRRDVQARSPRSADWRKARRNMALWKLYRVSTGKGSSAGIRFVDQSVLRMRASALLVIYGSSARRTSSMGRLIKTTVRLERGTIKGGLSRLDREAGLQVRTPSSVITLRSRLSQVEVDKIKTSIVSVYTGLASVLARGVRVLVPKGYGTYVRRGARPAKPRILPPPPRWAGSTGDAVVLLPAGHTGGFEARWTGPRRATRFRVEVAKDPRFNQILVDAVVGAGIRRFRAKGLSAGTYWARVASIDKHRLEGSPCKPIRVRLLPLHSSRRLRRDMDGTYLAVGLLRLDLSARHGKGVLASTDGGPFLPASTLRLATPGDHLIRVRLAGRRSVTTLRIRILSVGAQITIPSTANLRTDGPPVPVTVTLKDARGRPAVLPGLALHSSPGGRVPMRAVGPGRFTAKLMAPRRSLPGPIRLSLVWAAGRLTTVHVPVTTPTPPPRPRQTAPTLRKRTATPPPLRWKPAPAAFEWPRPGPGLPTRTALPTTFLGLASVMADRDAGNGRRELGLRMSLRGGLSLLRGRLGLDLDLPWYVADVTRESAGKSELGIPRIGARLVAWRGHGVTITPSLRLSGQAGDRRTVSFEPGVLLEWRHRSLLTLGTNQVLAADASVKRGAWTDSSLFWASSFYASLRPLRWLAVSSELGLALGLTGPRELDRALLLTFGGTVWLLPGRFRVGLSAAGGLTEDARRLLGTFALGLALDLAYRGL